MKIILSVITISVLILLYSCGQILDKGPISESDYPNFRVQFIDERNGWIVGPRIRKTQDGGSTWFIVETSKDAPLPLAGEGPAPVRYFSQFIDQQHGWIVSTIPYKHSVHYTEDGGYSWSSPISIQDKLYPLAIAFVSFEKGWVLGFEKVFLTNDQGKSWYEVMQLRGLSIRYPFTLDQDYIWLASEHGLIARTTNGGKDWIISQTLPKGVMAIYFITDTIGWAVGKNGLLAKTIDGGGSWQIQHLDKQSSFDSQKATLLDIFFLNTDLGWIVGSEGLALYSTDGGETWEKGMTPTRSPLGSVRFTNKLRGWAVGGNAKPVFPTGRPSNVVIETADGGKSWQAK